MRRLSFACFIILAFVLIFSVSAEIGETPPVSRWRKIDFITSVPRGRSVDLNAVEPDFWGPLDRVVPSQDGSFYFLKDGYIYQYDGAVTVFGKAAKLHSLTNFTYVNDTFYCLQRLKKKQVFRLIIYSPLRNDLRYLPMPKQISQYIRANPEIYYLKNERIWCGDIKTGKVAEWNGKYWRIVDWELTFRDKLANLHIFNDALGNLWLSGATQKSWNRKHTEFSAVNWGIIQRDGKSTLQLNLPANTALKFLAGDSDGYLWGDYWKIAEDQEYGLFRYKDLKFDYFPLKLTGISAYQSFVEGECRASFDNRGRLWLWWRTGLLKPGVFTQETGFQPLVAKEFIPDNRIKAILPTPYGYIWIVGTNFLTMINDSQETADTRPPETYLLNAPLEYITGNSYSFSVGAGDYYTGLKGIEYSFRLDGREWSAYIREDNFFLPYLADGPHVFRVRARDSAKNVDLSPARTEFIVNPQKWSLQLEKVEFANKLRLFSAHNRYYREHITESGQLELRNLSSRKLEVKIRIDLPSLTERPFAASVTINPGNRLTLPFVMYLNKNILVRENKTAKLEISVRYSYDRLRGGQDFSRLVTLMPTDEIYWDSPQALGAFVKKNSEEFSALVKRIAAESQIYNIYEANTTRAMQLFEVLNVWGFQIQPFNYQDVLRTRGGEVKLRLPDETLRKRSGNLLEISSLYATLLENAGISTIFLYAKGELLTLIDTRLRPEIYRDIFQHEPISFGKNSAAWLPIKLSGLKNGFARAIQDSWAYVDRVRYQIIDPRLWLDKPMGLWPPGSEFSEDLNSQALRMRLIRDVQTLTPAKEDFFQKANDYLIRLSLFTTDFDLKNEAAYFFSQKGQPELAIEILKRSYSDPNICSNLGVLLLQTGQLAEAENYLTLALSYNPGNEKTKQAIALLRTLETGENDIRQIQGPAKEAFQQSNQADNIPELSQLWSY